MTHPTGENTKEPRSPLKDLGTLALCTATLTFAMAGMEMMGDTFIKGSDFTGLPYTKNFALTSVAVVLLSSSLSFLASFLKNRKAKKNGPKGQAPAP